MAQRHRLSAYFPIFFLISDLISLNGAFLAANYLRFKTIVYLDDQYLTLQITLNLLWILVFFSGKLHLTLREQRLIEQLNLLLTALVANLAIVFAVWFITQPRHFSREHLFYTYLIFTTGVFIWRSVWYFFIRYSRAKGYNIRNVVIVGYNDLAESMVSYLNTNKGLGYKLKGVFADNETGKYDHLGRIGDIEEKLEDLNVDVIFCLLNEVGDERLKDIIDYAENNLIKVKILSQFSRIQYHTLTVQNYGAIPVLNVNAIPLDIPVNRIIKRAFDILFSLSVMIFILSWIIPIVALLIRLESKGPIFFKQSRHGKGNRPFMCWKFRTMVINKDADLKQATKDDARITRVGAVLRKTSIDELPQFINVLLGDMSVVGPRPHPIKLNEHFQPSIEKFWQRHAVKPGITGLAQARGFRGETSEFSAMSGRVRLDRFYVKNWSLILDFKIIIMTIISIMKGSENAY